MSVTIIYDGNSKGSIVHATVIALYRDCAPVPRNVNPVCNLEIDMQFRDSENVQSRDGANS